MIHIYNVCSIVIKIPPNVGSRYGYEEKGGENKNNPKDPAFAPGNPKNLKFCFLWRPDWANFRLCNG
jgi:hypothetical protein